MNSPPRILFNYAINRKSVYRVGNPLREWNSLSLSLYFLFLSFFFSLTRVADAITGEL